MTWRRLAFALVCSTIAQPLWAGEKSPGPPVEPNAGQWRTWVISAGKDYRAAPPPSASETQAELRTLADLVAGNDAADAARIANWDAGAPQYRWIDLISNRLLAGTPTADPRIASTPMSRWRCTTRRLPRGNQSITTAGSGRPRSNHRLPSAVDVPDSPSYPSEHAAAAQAAATMLALLPATEAHELPGDGRRGRRSRVLAGVQYPERLSRRARARAQSRRAGDREGPIRRLERALDRHRAHRSLQMDRREPRERRGRDLEIRCCCRPPASSARRLLRIACPRRSRRRRQPSARSREHSPPTPRPSTGRVPRG